MQPSGATSRVPIAVNRGITLALFCLAIIAYITRAYIRAGILKQFSIDDAFLLFAVICLCAVTGLAYASLPHLYSSFAVILHNAEASIVFDLLVQVPTISRESNAAATLWWFVLFPVKLAYLCFFRRLIFRVRGLNIWWWCVLVSTIISCLVSIAATWLTCPYFDLAGVLTCQGADASHRVMRDTGITTAVDIATDVMILSFPVALLWKVRINVRQKIGLGLSLCLSLVMILVSIVRISGGYLADGNVDIVWLAFLMQQECSIAVIMVSVSAFRSFFVAKAANTPNRGSPRRAPSGKWHLRRRPASEESDLERNKELPQIPGAALTGMSTALRDIRMSRMWPLSRDAEETMRLSGSTTAGERQSDEHESKGSSVFIA